MYMYAYAKLTHIIMAPARAGRTHYCASPHLESFDSFEELLLLLIQFITTTMIIICMAPARARIYNILYIVYCIYNIYLINCILIYCIFYILNIYILQYYNIYGSCEGWPHSLLRFASLGVI